MLFNALWLLVHVTCGTMAKSEHDQTVDFHVPLPGAGELLKTAQKIFIFLLHAEQIDAMITTTGKLLS